MVVVEDSRSKNPEAGGKRKRERGEKGASIEKRNVQYPALVLTFSFFPFFFSPCECYIRKKLIFMLFLLRIHTHTHTHTLTVRLRTRVSSRMVNEGCKEEEEDEKEEEVERRPALF